MSVHYEGALTKIQADQILSNFLGKAKVTSYWKEHTTAWVNKQFEDPLETKSFRSMAQPRVRQNRTNIFIPALSEEENKAFFDDAYDEALATSSS